MRAARLWIVVAAAACSKGGAHDSPPPATAAFPVPLASSPSKGDIATPTEDSLLDAFAVDRIPNTALTASVPSARRAWTWQGAAKKAQGQMDPFATTVAVTAVRIEPADTGPDYTGYVTWGCTGTGAFRCFEGRFSHEETRFVYAADARRWKALETRHLGR
jgi:hypothetical protein